MKRRVGNRTLKATAEILAVVFVVLVSFIFLRSWEKGYSVVETSEQTEITSDDEEELTYYNGGWYALRDDLETVLLMGLDKYEDTTQSGYLNNQQADFLLLLVLDHETETCVPIHLNRDTMTEITILGVTGAKAGSFTGQLALAHTYGSGGTDSCENAVEAVSNRLYGIEIDHYVSMTMDGVALLNDLAGGVTVEVLDDFSGIDDTLMAGETVTLQGQQALTYVRTRAGLEDSSNLHRMERQRQYLSALRTQLTSCADQDAKFVFATLMELSDYMVSDCTIRQLSDLAEAAKDYASTDYLTLEGEAVLGDEYMEYYVDEQAVQALVMDVFYEFVGNTEE